MYRMPSFLFSPLTLFFVADGDNCESMRRKFAFKQSKFETKVKVAKSTKSKFEIINRRLTFLTAKDFIYLVQKLQQKLI